MGCAFPPRRRSLFDVHRVSRRRRSTTVDTFQCSHFHRSPRSKMREDKLTERTQTQGRTIAPSPELSKYIKRCRRPYGEKSWAADWHAMRKQTMASSRRKMTTSASNMRQCPKAFFSFALPFLSDTSDAFLSGSQCGNAMRTRCLMWSSSANGGSSDRGR